MKKVWDVIVLVLLFIWQLPQNIIAILMMPFIGKMTLIEKRHWQYVFKADNMRGGISLGTFIFVSNNLAMQQTSIEHELGHGIDSKWMGPLYLFIIGIPSILHAALHKKCPCYYHFYTEKWANKHIGTLELVERDGWCYLRMK